jgi:hypothetical protein
LVKVLIAGKIGTLPHITYSKLKSYKKNPALEVPRQDFHLN